MSLIAWSNAAVKTPPQGALAADQHGPWIKQVEAQLATQLSGDAEVDTLAQAQALLVLAPAAKRLRPRFARLCADLVAGDLLTVTRAPWAAGVDADALRDGAVGVELVHAASLLHDDIVDNAQMRRGRPSANAAFGVATALLAGDRLLAEALGLFAPRALPQALATVKDMANAALLEVQLRGNARVTVEQCLSIADGKTAVLFGLAACVAGCATHGSADDIKRLVAAGRALGRAFQIVDDVDDLSRDSEERCNDLIERTPTLPIALARDVQQSIATLWRSPEVAREDAYACAEAMLAAGAGHRALDVARREVATLKDALSAYDDAAAYQSIVGVATALVRERA